MQTNQALVNAVKAVIKVNQHIAPGAVPGEMIIGPYGLFVQFAYPVVIEGCKCETNTYDIFDLIKEAESNATKTW